MLSKHTITNIKQFPLVMCFTMLITRYKLELITCFVELNLYATLWVFNTIGLFIGMQ